MNDKYVVILPVEKCLGRLDLYLQVWYVVGKKIEGLIKTKRLINYLASFISDKEIHL